MQTRRITTLGELALLAEDVLGAVSERETAHVIALEGDLGAGKTAFVKELARILKMKEEVTSPTFGIMKSYSIPAHSFLKTLTHIDAYRIDDVDEMRVLKFDELLEDTTRLICIEWPEKIASILPFSRHTLQLVLNPDESRDITF